MFVENQLNFKLIDTVVKRYLNLLPCIRFYSVAKMKECYNLTKATFQSKKLPKDVNPNGVFTCNQLDLRDIKVYGFDYDYTLVCYKESVDFLLYNLSKEMLIQEYKYPRGIADLNYQPDFAVRGLHYDIEKGVLLKLDCFLQIQNDSVYKGLRQLSPDEVLRIYPTSYNAKHMTHSYLNSKMIQVADLFSVPEMGLLINVSDYFERNGIDYHPEILFKDVITSIRHSHSIMHKEVAANISKYIEPNIKLRPYLEKLKNAGKEIFLLTNSAYHFANKGLEVLIGPDWKDFFDVLMFRAGKPSFFTDSSRPFRIYDEQSNSYTWDRVTKLQKGVIYYEGGVSKLQDLTGWKSRQLLYFGDHPYSDLADVTLKLGWRTGAIILELWYEISTLNKTEYKQDANWLHMLTQLIEENQDTVSPGEEQVLAEWMAERERLLKSTKVIFNKQFGSVFRTDYNPTYFSKRLFRYSDIYTSSITNMLRFSVNHTFYPRRGVMPHEYFSHFM